MSTENVIFLIIKYCNKIYIKKKNSKSGKVGLQLEDM